MYLHGDITYYVVFLIIVAERHAISAKSGQPGNRVTPRLACSHMLAMERVLGVEHHLDAAQRFRQVLIVGTSAQIVRLEIAHVSLSRIQDSETELDKIPGPIP